MDTPSSDAPEEQRQPEKGRFPEKGSKNGLRPIPDTEHSVIQDILSRQKLGIPKYGTTVANNPQDLKAWLTEAYQETLDQAIYLKRAIQELEQNQ